ncbi:TNF receptor-associated factor 6 [Galendromus occidentalis]|uniref:TNF receptor-associated factor 6 n=1 Tax=Galendromus occidentalis TaxID=34638 RepID=A0AAJ6VXX4_9ACAR|nr:TNF receptor-associated factor 6 [Galendromus occidentalis]
MESDPPMNSSPSEATGADASGSNVKIRLVALSGIPEDTEMPFIDMPPASILCAQCSCLGPSLWRFPCGHGFCAPCFERTMPSEADKTICPIDQQSISRMTVFQDSSIQELAFPLRSLCPHECGETIRLCTLPVHLQYCDKLQDKLAIKRCFLRGMGCTYEANNEEELTAHETDLKLHRGMISLKVQELNHVDVLRNQVNEALASLVEATQNQRDLTNRIALLEGRLEEMQTERREQTRSSSLPDVMAPPPAAQPTFSLQLGPMSITTFGSEHHLPSLGATSTSRGAQELICPDGIFQWKLSQFSRAKFKERHSPKKYTSSPSFYAGNPGYHFKLRLHLNGIGSAGRGKYLGVGIVLLKGQFDASLPFPIHNPITVTLIDQSSKCPENVEYRLGDPSINRPKSDYVVPYIWHEFISFEDLEGPRFMVNDTIIFRIQVSPIQNGQQPAQAQGQAALYPSLG